MSGSSTCRSCRRPIVWGVTSAGKNMPVDADPVADGNVRLDPSMRDGRIHFDIVVTSDPPEPDEKRYRSHFTSCPNADQHRRRR